MKNPHPPTTLPGTATSVSEFENALTSAINRHSAENGSNTPDFILSQFLVRCLQAYDATVRLRAQWYGRIDGPAESWMSEKEVRQLLGFLTVELPELHEVEMHRMATALESFKAALERERQKPSTSGGSGPVPSVEVDPRD